MNKDENKSVWQKTVIPSRYVPLFIIFVGVLCVFMYDAYIQAVNGPVIGSIFAPVVEIENGMAPMRVLPPPPPSEVTIPVKRDVPQFPCSKNFQRFNGPYYIRDDGAICHQSRYEVIAWVDKESFVELGELHAKDKNGVYYLGANHYLNWNADWGPRDWVVMEGADPETFIILSSNTNFIAKDKNSVYVMPEAIGYADPETFEVVTREVDLWPSYYYKDKNHTYVLLNKKLAIVSHDSEVDIDTLFKIDRRSQDESYRNEDGQMYFAQKLVSGADAGSFSVFLSPHERPCKGNPDAGAEYARYGKDSNNVYYKGELVMGADVDTYEMVYSGCYLQEYAKDKNQAYYKGKAIGGSDPATFKVFASQPYEGCGYGDFSLDKNYVYFEDKIVPYAEPVTFEVVLSDFGKDHDSVFWRNVLQTQFDAEDFDLDCDYG